jgi:hypothetical protein
MVMPWQKEVLMRFGWFVLFDLFDLFGLLGWVWKQSEEVPKKNSSLEVRRWKVSKVYLVV